MWIDLKKHIKMWEVEKRPNFFLGWDKAEKEHLDKYWITFRQRTELEVDAIESVHKK